MRIQMNGCCGRIGATAVALSALMGFCPGALGQSCPVQVVSVVRQALTSDLGDYGAALRVAIRNTSPFPIRRVDLGMQITRDVKTAPRPAAIIGDRVLLPNTTETLLWNATRFAKRNGGHQNFILWPAFIEFGDGSRWAGNSAQCVYRSDGAAPERRSVPGAESPTAAELQSKEARLQGLIKKGKASFAIVKSDPLGASVYADARLIGKTPLSFILMKNANGAPRDIIVYKKGYTIKETDVTPAGQPITIDEHLALLP